MRTHKIKLSIFGILGLAWFAPSVASGIKDIPELFRQVPRLEVGHLHSSISTVSYQDLSDALAAQNVLENYTDLLEEQVVDSRVYAETGISRD